MAITTTLRLQYEIKEADLVVVGGAFYPEIVRDFLRGRLVAESDEGRLQVTDYNLEKGFGFQQNRGKGSIKQYLSW